MRQNRLPAVTRGVLAVALATCLGSSLARQAKADTLVAPNLQLSGTVSVSGPDGLTAVATRPSLVAVRTAPTRFQVASAGSFQLAEDDEDEDEDDDDVDDDDDPEDDESDDDE